MNAATFEIDRELYPFTSRTIALSNGAIVHFIDEGHGPVLLLLHGNPTWSFLYRDIILGLRDRFRCVAPDYPGFGRSRAPPDYGFTAAEQAEAMAEFVEALDLRAVTVMVHDWGGPIGFALAQRLPGRIRGFVIANTWAWPIRRLRHIVFSRVMGGLVGRMLAWCCNGIVRLFLWQGVATGLDPRARAMYLAPFDERGRRGATRIFPRQLRAAGPFLAEVCKKMGTLTGRPALIVWGGRDLAFGAPERSNFERLFPDHTTVLLPSAGHFVQEDAPEAVVQAIRGWFATNGRVAEPR